MAFATFHIGGQTFTFTVADADLVRFLIAIKVAPTQTEPQAAPVVETNEAPKIIEIDRAEYISKEAVIDFLAGVTSRSVAGRVWAQLCSSARNGVAFDARCKGCGHPITHKTCGVGNRYTHTGALRDDFLISRSSIVSQAYHVTADMHRVGPDMVRFLHLLVEELERDR